MVLCGLFTFPATGTDQTYVPSPVQFEFLTDPEAWESDVKALDI